MSGNKKWFNDLAGGEVFQKLKQEVWGHHCHYGISFYLPEIQSALKLWPLDWYYVVLQICHSPRENKQMSTKNRLCEGTSVQ